MKTKKILALTLAALTLCTILCACGTPAKKEAESDATATQKEMAIGILELNSAETSAQEGMIKVEKRTPKGLVPFSSLNTMLMEFNAGRVDGMLLSESVSKYLCTKDDKLLMTSQKTSQNYRMATRESDTELNSKIDKAIGELKSDGTIDQLVTDYIAKAGGDPTANAPTKREGGQTYTVAVTGDLPPLDYVAADGTPAGFNVALLDAIAEKIGCNFEILQLDANARLSALESKKIDLIFWMRCLGSSDAELAAKGVLLTGAYFEEDMYAVSHSQDVLDKITAILAPQK